MFKQKKSPKFSKNFQKPEKFKSALCAPDGGVLPKFSMTELVFDPHCPYLSITLPRHSLIRKPYQAWTNTFQCKKIKD